MRTHLARWIRALWPVILWTCLMFLGSTDALSGQRTSRFLAPLIRRFFPDLTSQEMGQVLFTLRKMAHVAEYAFLALLLYRGLRILREQERKAWSASTAWLTWIGCVLFAMSDEWHQSWTSTRVPSLLDVGFDSLGAGLMVFFLWFWKRRQSR